MSVKQAFAFIQKVRCDKALADRLDPESGLQSLWAIAQETGYRCTVDEIRSAIAKDAAMRRWYYASR